MKKFQVKEFSIIPPPYGGVSVYIKRLINQLNHDGVSAGGYYANDNTDQDIIKSPLFDLFEWKASQNKVHRAVSHIKRILRASREYQIIHIHGQEMIYLPAILHLLKGQIIVSTVHNAMIVDYYKNMSSINRWGFNYLARHNVQWIAVSEQVKNELLKLPIDFYNPILVIPAYIPDNTTHAALPDPMRGYISKHEKIISFYGRSFMEFEGQDVYGFRTAIRAFKFLIDNSAWNVGLVLCISDISDKEAISNLRKYAEELGVDNEIYWQYGGISGIRALWQSSDVYLRPTKTDGDSVSIRDAMAEGATVVASDVCPRPKEVVIYRFDDEEDLANKLCICLNNGKREHSHTMDFYDQMKSIYIRLLH